MRELAGWLGDLLVVVLDHLGHQSGDGIGIQRLAPFADEDQAAAVGPRGSGGESLLGLPAKMVPDCGDGLVIDADHAGSATLSGAFDTVSSYDGRRAA